MADFKKKVKNMHLLKSRKGELMGNLGKERKLRKVKRDEQENF